MKKHKDKLAGFGIEAAIQHALTLNEEADNADMIILECGHTALYQVFAMERFMRTSLESASIIFPHKPLLGQYTGIEGVIICESVNVLVFQDLSLADKVFVIHDEDYQWSVSTTVE